MKIMEFSSAKGGTGTTTAASAAAVCMAKDGKNVLLIDLGLARDTAAWFGLQSYTRRMDDTREAYNITLFSPWYDAPNVSNVTIPDGEWDVVVVDAGRLQPRYQGEHEIERIGVVRSQYMALRNAAVPSSEAPWDRYVVMVDESDVLNFQDASAVLGKHCVKASWNPQTARSIDAGLISTRHSEYEGWVQELLQPSNA